MEKALHAACMLQSRAFHMQADNWVTGVVSKGSQLFMLPGIDMVNHSCNPKDLNTTLRYIKVDCSSEEANCLGGISKLNQEKCSTASSHSYFVMKAEQDIKAGEPILHSYGDLSDGQLLQVYGFIGSTDDHQNPHNWVAVPWKIVKESCCDIAKRKDWPLGDICKREDFLCNQKLLYCPVDEVQFAVATHQELPKELVTVVQILLMAAEDFADVVKEYVGDCSLEPGNRPLVMGERYMDSSDWSEVVCLALLKTLDMCLCMYPTTFEEDSALLASDKMLPNSPRRLAAVLLRMEEKQILKAARKQVLTLLVRCCNEEDEEESGDGSHDFDSDEDDEGDGEDSDSLEDEDDVEKGTKTGRNKRQRTNC
ncbi:unnamed protein product [Ostreobium quekettii]|uniref:SET domain-containing protein n=1 Tax=Ostreobium quekettii TaxID=121088 RepID=A0A8S1IQW9_9CHLO|nr:unnamed protein product [Ostreobium quekettii]